MSNYLEPEKDEDEIRRLKREKLRKKRRLMARKRARRNRLILLAVVFIVIATGIVLGVNLLRDALTPTSDVTLLTLNPDGSVVFEEVVNVTDGYDTSKLKSFAKKQIKQYEPAEGEKVKLDKVSVKNSKAYIRSKYSSADTYNDFTGYETFFGTINEAISKGYDIESNVPDQYRVDKDREILILRQAIKVKCPKNVAYASERFATIGNDNIVTISTIKEGSESAPLVFIVMDDEEDSDKTTSESAGE